jgi:flagellar hook-associated protein 2
MAQSTFNVGGLASGLDTNSIIDQLVKIEGSSVTAARARQTAYQAQISQLGDLTSKLNALASSLTTLKTSGGLAFAQQGTTSGFSVTPGSSATAGRYGVTVDALAGVAKSRSAQFTAPTDVVRAGTLDLSVNGTTTSVTLTDGMTLSQAAKAINDSGAAVTATVLSSNGQAFLNVVSKNTGFTPGQPAASALTVTETSTGVTGQALGLAITQSATNAKLSIDGLQFERSSNTIDDALPGVAFTLKSVTTVAEDLVLGTDTSATATNLGKFVTAYNDVMTLLRKNLNIGQQTDRTKTLGGDSAIRSLQSSLLSTVSSVLNPSSAIRSLADLGIKTGSDGTISIDQGRLGKAIAIDSAAVNTIFQVTDGVADKLKTLVTGYTDSNNGILQQKSKSYGKTIKDLDLQIDKLELRLDAYRTKLVSQFTAMEKVVSGFKSIGNYLTSQEARNTSKG